MVARFECGGRRLRVVRQFLLPVRFTWGEPRQLIGIKPVPQALVARFQMMQLRFILTLGHVFRRRVTPHAVQVQLRLAQLCRYTYPPKRKARF